MQRQLLFYVASATRQSGIYVWQGTHIY
eukprot:COSAG02_NODE_59275_length_274_cov_2.960000_1_plen_27_part_10